MSNVITAERCVECCERTVKQLNVEIGAVLSGLLAALQQADGVNHAWMVPVGFGAAATRGYASITLAPSEAAAFAAGGVVAPLIGGAVLLSTAVDLVNLSSEKASFDTLALTIGAIQNYFDIRDSPDIETAPALDPGRRGPRTTTGTKTKTRKNCEDCVKRRILSQAAPRQRQKVKILRRL